MNETKSELNSGGEQHLNGVYGGWELLIAGVVLVVVALLDVAYLQLYLSGREPVYVFSAVMISALGALYCGFRSQGDGSKRPEKPDSQISWPYLTMRYLLRFRWYRLFWVNKRWAAF